MDVFLQSDGLPVAKIQVINHQQAQIFISHLHRQKIGQKRITISYDQNNTPDTQHLKAMIIQILQVRILNYVLEY